MGTKSYTTHTWCVAYINRDHLGRVKRDLKKFKNFMRQVDPSIPSKDLKIEAYIPTVRFVKKNFKGKEVFETVPLLFNYGFFKVPKYLARNPEWLTNLRKHIACVQGWVNDPARIYVKKPNLRPDNTQGDIKVLKHSPPACATVTDREIEAMIKASEKHSVFSDIEISKLSPGDTITLKGYPFDNIPAEIVSIHKQAKKVTVKLLLDSMMTEVKVSFENIFYTVYSDYDDERGLKEKSLDDVKIMGNKQVDKIYARVNYNWDNDEDKH